jgi:hypothetical protein
MLRVSLLVPNLTACRRTTYEADVQFDVPNGWAAASLLDEQGA